MDESQTIEVKVDGEPVVPAVEPVQAAPVAPEAPAEPVIPAEPAAPPAAPAPRAGFGMPGRLIVQKAVKDLEAELDSGKFASIEDFIKAHFEADDANVQRIAGVLRMDVSEVWSIIKDLGYKLPSGL